MCDLGTTQMAGKVQNQSTWNPWNQLQEQLQEHIFQGRYHKFLSAVPLDSRGSVIFDDLSPTHGALPITPLIDLPKGISSKKGLEVA